MSLIDELKRRKVFKVGAAYLVVAWLVVQAASIGFPAFDAPPWALRSFILVAFLGFPVALVMAWVFDATPEGVRLDPASTGTVRVFAFATLLAVLALGWFFYGQPAFRKGDAPPKPGFEHAAADGENPHADPGSSQPVSKKSIAVLPFTDLSPGHDQEYFSDGMSEEILNALAKVKDLKVAGRTSAFSFKGKNEDLRAVGKALAVATVLEGSVRKQDDKVRITAQLIQAEDGYHLWSESYDGDLKDVFALQERIARAITEQLKVVLAGGQEQRLVPVATANPEAYALYLQATSIFNRRDGARMPDAIKQLEHAIELDPGFARAYSRLCAVLAIASIYADGPIDSERIGQVARRASELDPHLGEPHAALAQALVKQRRYLDAWPEFEQALRLEPDDVTANFWWGIYLVQTGYIGRGNAQLDRVLELDPMLPNALFWRGLQYLYVDDVEHGERLLQRASDQRLAYVDTALAAIAATRGQREQAVRLYANGLRGLQINLAEEDSLTLARGVYGGDAKQRAEALAWIERDIAAHPRPPRFADIRVLIQMGEGARAIAYSSDRPTANEASYVPLFWAPVGKSIRTLPAFAEYARKTGLAAVWDKHGPPDHCKQGAPGDYACE